MPRVREIENALFELAPKSLAQSWDNVGLLVGDGKREVHLPLGRSRLRTSARKSDRGISAGKTPIFGKFPTVP